jgi:hypothetical protein
MKHGVWNIFGNIFIGHMYCKNFDTTFQMSPLLHDNATFLTLTKKRLADFINFKCSRYGRR